MSQTLVTLAFFGTNLHAIELNRVYSACLSSTYTVAVSEAEARAEAARRCEDSEPKCVVLLY